MVHQRVAEVVVEVAVDAVHVIGPVLRIVVLNQERRTLNKIMVRLSGLQTAGPLKMDRLRAGTRDAGQVLIGEFLADAPDLSDWGKSDRKPRGRWALNR
jgi:hypothetical protein